MSGAANGVRNGRIMLGDAASGVGVVVLAGYQLTHILVRHL